MTFNREPKGTTTGGQFAPSVNPEPTVELSNLRAPTLTMEVAVSRIHSYLDERGWYDPNEEGLELLRRSSMTITSEIETLRGIAWSGHLNVGDTRIDVSNSGEGGGNDYACEEGRSKVEAIEEEVRRGFPRLIDSEVLDSFCMVAEIVHMPPEAKSA
jgi:hypothetical protein